MSKFLKLNAIGADLFTEEIILNSDYVIAVEKEVNINEYEELSDFVEREKWDISAASLIIKQDAIDFIDYVCERTWDLVPDKFAACPADLSALCIGSNRLWVTNSKEDILAQLNGVFVRKGDV
ncbi:hypothetical protein [Haemophilus influenzae]|uniref:hypothetical protein n=1 Tax=Haemophilus influenzae TaxID=727 RepID=UPI003DA38F6D